MEKNIKEKIIDILNQINSSEKLEKIYIFVKRMLVK